MLRKEKCNMNNMLNLTSGGVLLLHYKGKEARHWSDLVSVDSLGRGSEA